VTAASAAAAAAAGLLLGAPPEGDIDRLLRGAPQQASGT